jgi:hypothetical protein
VWVARTSTQNKALAAVGAAVLLVAFVPFAFIAVQAAAHHRVFLGVDSFVPSDDLQYLAWVSDAHHGLIRNLYGAAGDQALFVHPMWSPSGWIQALTGVSDAVIMGFWTLVAALTLFAGCVWLACRHIPAERPWGRVLAVVLMIFGGLTPAILLMTQIGSGNQSVTTMLAANDLLPVADLWGYAPMAIAIGLMPFAVEGTVRIAAGSASRRAVALTAAVGLLIGWLHPWQGETLLVVCAGLGLWHLRERRSIRALIPLIPVAAAIAVPLAYYAILGHVDPGWSVAKQNNDGVLRPISLITSVAPLAAVALICGWRARHDAAARGLVLWPVATLLVVAATPSGQNRALAGLGLPVAVLLVRAWPVRGTRSLRALIPALATVAAITIPLVPFLSDSWTNLDSPMMAMVAEPTHADVEASLIAARDSGGLPVISSYALGAAIPVVADTPSWLGQSIWTPHWTSRMMRTVEIFLGSPSTSVERAALGTVRTHVLLQPCGYGQPVEGALAPLGFREQQVGCARLYVRPSSVSSA